MLENGASAPSCSVLVERCGADPSSTGTPAASAARTCSARPVRETPTIGTSTVSSRPREPCRDRPVDEHRAGARGGELSHRLPASSARRAAARRSRRPGCSRPGRRAARGFPRVTATIWRLGSATTGAVNARARPDGAAERRLARGEHPQAARRSTCTVGLRTRESAAATPRTPEVPAGPRCSRSPGRQGRRCPSAPRRACRARARRRPRVRAGRPGTRRTARRPRPARSARRRARRRPRSGRRLPRAPPAAGRCGRRPRRPPSASGCHPATRMGSTRRARRHAAQPRRPAAPARSPASSVAWRSGLPGAVGFWRAIGSPSASITSMPGQQPSLEERVARVDPRVEQGDRDARAVDAGKLDPTRRPLAGPKASVCEGRSRDRRRVCGAHRVDAGDCRVALERRQEHRVDRRGEAVEHAHVRLLRLDGRAAPEETRRSRAAARLRRPRPGPHLRCSVARPRAPDAVGERRRPQDDDPAAAELRLRAAAEEPLPALGADRPCRLPPTRRRAARTAAATRATRTSASCDA